MNGEAEGDWCSQCGHATDPHHIFLPVDPSNPDFGMRFHGWMICPEMGCECFTTISVQAGVEPEGLDRATWAIAYALMKRDSTELETGILQGHEYDLHEEALFMILGSLPKHVQDWWFGHELLMGLIQQ